MNNDHYVYTNSRGQKKYLNCKTVKLVNSPKPSISYYFSNDYRPDEACALPDDREPVENSRNAHPVLRKKK